MKLSARLKPTPDWCTEHSTLSLQAILRCKKLTIQIPGHYHPCALQPQQESPQEDPEEVPTSLRSNKDDNMPQFLSRNRLNIPGNIKLAASFIWSPILASQLALRSCSRDTSLLRISYWFEIDSHLNRTPTNVVAPAYRYYRSNRGPLVPRIFQTLHVPSH